MSRILYSTAESHPTWRADVGVLFGKALPACGVAVDLVAVAEPGDPPVRWAGGQAILRPATGRGGRMLSDVLQQLRLFGLCRSGAYDALVVRDKPVLGLIGMLAARSAGIPFVYWMSYPLPEQYLWLGSRDDGGIGRLRRAWLRLRGRAGLAALARWLVPGADWLFVQTDEMARRLRAEGTLRHDRVTPVPMGVDLEALPPPATRLPDGLEGARTAVYLGTLDRSRRPEVLVDTALKVAQRVPGFRMVIVGEADEPSDRGWLPAYAERVGAAHCVVFTGRLPSREALALAQRMEVGLSPVPRNHLTEVGSPTKAVEYLACGLPVVCNDQPDQAWVVERSGGGLVTGFDADAFADAIVTVLHAPDAFRARARAARDWVAAHRDYAVLGRLVADRMRALASPGVDARAARLRVDR